MNTHYKRFRNFLGVIAGNVILAYGVAAFYIPAGLAVGGSTGVGVILHQIFGADTAVSVFIINAALLAAGLLCVGGEFVVSAVLGSVVYPLFLGLFQRLPVPDILAQDKLAGVVCAGFLVGLGVGLTIRVGSSTGGQRHPGDHLQQGVPSAGTPGEAVCGLYGVMLLTFLVVSADGLIYSLLTLAVEVLVMDRIMVLGTSQLQLLIMSDRHERVPLPAGK